MAIWVKICPAEQKYMSFFGPSPSAISYTNDETLRSGFFPAKHAQWSSCILEFFQGFIDKGLVQMCLRNYIDLDSKLWMKKVALVQNKTSSPSMKVIWTWYFHIIEWITICTLSIGTHGGWGSVPPRKTAGGKNKEIFITQFTQCLVCYRKNLVPRGMNFDPVKCVEEIISRVGYACELNLFPDYFHIECSKWTLIHFQIVRKMNFDPLLIFDAIIRKWIKV